ncbi:hypothetical protein O6H91_08G014900 [Diphasiastrum complanatum]|uniref:Uncharacterized protein n=1 Tax=Diphasiastrum complanatum TaxID=34168 RepID=A0ACC2CVE6_DIPCM|nr:hypothetical protein O6H91_08G014900 [Diphasiastrum complanatum]
MDLLHTALNLFLPPAGIFFLVTISPTLAFIKACQWLLSYVFCENIYRKVVIITGASSGIGEHYVQHLAYQYGERGARLVLVARRDDLLRRVADRARKRGAKDVLVIPADVARKEECKRVIDETIDRFGRLDHLVNNAGVTHSFFFEEATDTSAFTPLIDITFWGDVYPTYYALPHLRRTRGKILVTASVASWLPYPRMSMYNSAKAAIFNLYETLRVELGSDVGVTIAMPGWIESEMTKGKFVSPEGDAALKPEQRDVDVGPFPVAYAEECAQAIVTGALRGKHYVIYPFWYSTLLLYRVFAPELLEWSYRLLFVSKAPGTDEPPSKIILKTTGAQPHLYPSSIQKAE